MDSLFSPSPRTRYFVGWDARATWFLRSVLPDRIVDAMFNSLIDNNDMDFQTYENGNILDYKNGISLENLIQLQTNTKL